MEERNIIFIAFEWLRWCDATSTQADRVPIAEQKIVHFAKDFFSLFVLHWRASNINKPNVLKPLALSALNVRQ